MATSTPNAPAPTADIKAELEAFVGNPIDVTNEQIGQQLLKLRVPVSSYAFTLADSGGAGLDPFGHVRSNPIVVVLPPTCTTSGLLDLSGTAFTSAAGNVTLEVNNFLCPDVGSLVYDQPINVVATPVSRSPAFVTVTNSPVDCNVRGRRAIGIPGEHRQLHIGGKGGIWRRKDQGCRVPASIFIQ